MAQTLDGKIAKDADHFPDWTGPEDKKLFVKLTKQAGCLIMGSKTYDTIGRPLPGRKNVIMTKDKKKLEVNS
ncbi:dihydrofolate reductase, partial [Desulfobacterales bacterium HSG17]|nr:dihydrofolate reductase [Desulfobacterales bacterium HSG17]